MKLNKKTNIIIELTEKEAQILDMILCDYENEGENHSKEEYLTMLNPMVDTLRNFLNFG